MECLPALFVSLHAGTNVLMYQFYSMLLHKDTCNVYLYTGNNVITTLFMLNLSLLIHLCSFCIDRCRCVTNNSMKQNHYAEGDNVSVNHDVPCLY